jgi:hypothetical protein
MLYVDDIFITGSCEKLIAWLKAFLYKQFDIKDLGPIQCYLCILFETPCKGIFIHHRKYVHSILHDFGMVDCKSSSTPLPEGIVLVIYMKIPYINSTYYCKLVGKLIFLTITRSDLFYAVS